MPQVVLEVEGMSCQACVASVTRAIQGVDPDARVRVGLAEGRVEADTREAPARLVEAVEAAGYDARQAGV